MLYLDDIMRAIDIYSGDILWDEKSCKTCENILWHFIQNVYGFNDKIDGFMKIYNGIRYLVILCNSWFDKICESIKYLIS